MQTALLGRMAIITGSDGSPIEHEAKVCEIVNVFPESNISLEITVRLLESNRLHDLKSCDICVMSAYMSRYYQEIFGTQELHHWSKKIPNPKLNFESLDKEDIGGDEVE